MRDAIKTLILGSALLFAGLLFLMAALSPYYLLPDDVLLAVRIIAGILCLAAGITIILDANKQATTS